VLFAVPSSFRLCLDNQFTLFKVRNGSRDSVCETRAGGWGEETEARAIAGRSRGLEWIGRLGRVTRNGV
jgi:hypothetical protein